MRTIGITGGVGAGKSKLLSYIGEHYNCRIVLADEVAHLVKEPGQSCYDPLVALLGEDVLLENGYIDKAKMAVKIFADENLLKAVNALIHPAVKQYILDEIAKEQEVGELEFFFLEAALLIEEKYDEILDELWFIYADECVRRERLKASRNYSDEKIDSIMRSQLSEDIFREHCKFVIDNSGAPEDAYRQIDDRLRGYGIDNE